MRVIEDKSAIEPYLSDESNALKASPDCVSRVFYPENHIDLTSILRGDYGGTSNCTMSGAGTGVTGSRVPLCGGSIISMERMLCAAPREGWDMIKAEYPAGRAMILVSQDRSAAIVPPGITLDMLSEMLPQDVFYPPDPTESSAQIGSTVATNASGARTFYYGPTRDWIRALMVVLANGDSIRMRRGKIRASDDGHIRFGTASGQTYDVPLPSYSMPQVKNAAGLYASPGMDLIDLFIGSEGILGIISEIEIKLAPRPSELITDVAFFGSEADALGYADDLRVLREEGIIAIEHFDANSLAFMREKETRIKESFRAAVMVEALGDRESTIDKIFESCEAHSVIDDWSGPPSDFKEFRHSLPESVNSYLRQHDSHKLATDFAVPAAHFPEMMVAYREADEAFAAKFPRPGVHTVLFGHLGDYHLHFNFIAANGPEMAFAKGLYLGLAKKVVAFGGTISAEHGVGKKSIEIDGRDVPYLQLMYGERGLADISAVKRILDPDFVLNVGNMVRE
ncbi:MAG: FAD-binding oxidoreductase [Candidatus Coatesbacteria bacterium]|nr:FAD-binding oxidoreductase [Candidatus Coatesbacteria bacterium]